MTLTDLKPGNKLTGFAHWGCIPPRAKRAVFFCEDGPYLQCSHGRHLLHGQQDDDGELVGLSFA
jgi:hypothetical protein